VSRDDAARLRDISRAIDRIDTYLARDDIRSEVVYDAVRMRLVEIGEAVARLSPTVTDHAPQIPWRDIAAMRNHLVHQYFDTAFDIIEATVTREISPLRHVVDELQKRVGAD